MADLIIKGASENNLKSIDVKIEANKITGIIGPSGSGKSTLAFNTIYAEGQRRYIESLSSYARQFLEKIDKPKYSSIENISPTIAIEQKNKIKNSRGTLGFITEIDDYLRILFSLVGKLYCPKCSTRIIKFDVPSLVDELFTKYIGMRVYLIFKKRCGIDELIKSGYKRILVGDETINIIDGKIPKKLKEFLVIYDRFMIEDDEKTRILDSLNSVSKISSQSISIYLYDKKEIHHYYFENICPKCSYVAPEIDVNFFSYDSPVGACEECKGFGNILRWDEDKLIPNKEKSLLGGAIDLLNKPSMKPFFYSMINFLRTKNVDVNKPFNELTKLEIKHIYDGGGKGKTLFYGLNKMFKEFERRQYKVYIKMILNKYRSAFLCEVCQGSRLKQEALSVLINEKNIFDLQSKSVLELNKFLLSLDLSNDEKDLCREALKQLFQRTSFLIEIGLSYLTINRLAKTLSNGEAQRINLANQLSSSLVDTIYVLDEPSIGLHPRDTSKLIEIIKRLRDNGNKVIVVEHDKVLISSFDNIIELGPKSGIMGGSLVFSGSISDFLNADTISAKELTKNVFKRLHPVKLIGEYTKFVEIHNAYENNLKNIDVKIPLERLVCVTGVSGSGKSSLVSKCLFSGLEKHFNEDSINNAKYDSITGLENINDYCIINQNAVSKSSKSTPITFLKAFDGIRTVFSQTTLARSRGYTASHFSFNTKQGQCPECGGAGFTNVDMYFMSDVTMKCEHCSGTRYKPEILDITYKGLNIAEVLELSVAEAYEFFIFITSLRSVLKLLMDVGLDYIQIGQSFDTLSGGETQRLKICSQLIKHSSRKTRLRTIYIIDEPTTGLHTIEVYSLIEILQRLINEGNSVVAIEHNLDFIANSDYVIDLGLDGGDMGGQIVAQGYPDQIIEEKKSHTAKFLKKFIYST